MASETLLSRAQSAFTRLSESERRLVTLLLVTASVLLCALFLWGMSSAISKREKLVKDRTADLDNMEVLREAYEQASAAEKKTQSKLRANATPLFTQVKDALSEYGLPAPDLQERRTPVKDSDVTEVSVDVPVKEMSIDKFQALLERFEGRRGDTAVKVTKIKVKTRFDNPELLEGTLTVSTWKSDGKAADGKATDGKATDGKGATP